MHTFACDEFVLQLFEEEGFIGLGVLTVISSTIIVGVIAGTISSIFKTRAKEMTRREIAAYVAEGSLRPEDAVAVLNAGKKNAVNVQV